MHHDKRQLTAFVLAFLLWTALLGPAAALRYVRAEDPYAEIERLKEEQQRSTRKKNGSNMRSPSSKTRRR